MGVIKFLLSRNREKSLLAAQKYGEKQANLDELDKPLLAHKFPTFEEHEKSINADELEVCVLGRKEYPKIFTEAEENEKEV